MARLRDDSLLPQTGISSELLVNTNGVSFPMRDSLEGDHLPLTRQSQPFLQPEASFSYEFGLKPSQLLTLRKIKESLRERELIGRQLKRYEITEEYMKDYASKMPLFLIHGAPGCGKSYLVSKIRQMVESFQLNSIVMAFSGTAASQFQNGRTIHSSCGWSAKKTMSNFSSISRNNVPSKVAMLGPQPSMVIIDECSMLGPQWVSNISNTMKEIMRSKISDFNNTESDDTFISNTTLNFINNAPFGSLLTILSGDFFQIPCIGDRSIYSAVVD